MTKEQIEQNFKNILDGKPINNVIHATLKKEYDNHNLTHEQKSIFNKLTYVQNYGWYKQEKATQIEQDMRTQENRKRFNEFQICKDTYNRLSAKLKTASTPADEFLIRHELSQIGKRMLELK